MKRILMPAGGERLARLWLVCLFAAGMLLSSPLFAAGAAHTDRLRQLMGRAVAGSAAAQPLTVIVELGQTAALTRALARTGGGTLRYSAGCHHC